MWQAQDRRASTAAAVWVVSQTCGLQALSGAPFGFLLSFFILSCCLSLNMYFVYLRTLIKGYLLEGDGGIEWKCTSQVSSECGGLDSMQGTQPGKRGRWCPKRKPETYVRSAGPQLNLGGPHLRVTA